MALSKPTVTSKPSPNRGYGGQAFVPKAVVWHITSGSGASAVNWLSNPAANASANYVIMESGEIVELVNPEAGPNGAAWANGDVQNPDMSNALIASWVNGGVNPNVRVVSIEHAGQTSYGKGGSLTAAQVAATIKLTAWLCQRFNIAPDQDHILGHYQINDVTRHNCPGFSAQEWTDWVGKVATLVKGGSVSTPGNAIGEALKDKGKPEGYLSMGQPDTFDWQGEGVVVGREVVYFNPDTKVYYRRTWHNITGFTPWEVVK